MARNTCPIGGKYYSVLRALPEDRVRRLRVMLTRPSRHSIGAGDLRLIAERRLPDGVVWVLAYERYVRLVG